MQYYYRHVTLSIHVQSNWLHCWMYFESMELTILLINMEICI